jgi:hypothetical protein
MRAATFATLAFAPETGVRRMAMKKLLSVLALLGTLGPSGLKAGEGSIPIYQPTTISQPGHYILTRDLSITGGDGITILANDTTLDLNGHSVSSSSTTGSMVEIGSGFTNVAIRNGILAGGNYGVHYVSTTARANISIQRLRISVSSPGTAAISIMGADLVEVSSCDIDMTDPFAGDSALSPAAVRVNVDEINTDAGCFSGLGSFTGNISMNNITEKGGYDGILLCYLQGGAVRSNRVINSVYFPDGGIFLADNGPGPRTTSTVIEDNFVEAPDLGLAGIAADRPGKVIDNIIMGTASVPRGGGIAVSGYSLIMGNVVHGSSDGGISVGSNCLLEANLIEGSSRGCGILLSDTGNTFRNNVLRNDAGGGVCDLGTNNFDAGGNTF